MGRESSRCMVWSLGVCVLEWSLSAGLPDAANRTGFAMRDVSSGSSANGKRGSRASVSHPSSSVVVVLKVKEEHESVRGRWWGKDGAREVTPDGKR